MKNNEDLNSDTPIKNKAGLCTFKYKLKIKVATSNNTKQNFKPLFLTFKIEVSIFLKLLVTNFIQAPPIKLILKVSVIQSVK